MIVRSIWENVYALKRIKPKGNIFFGIIFLFVLLCFLFLFYFKFPKGSRYEGVYHCDEVCKLQTVLLFSDSKLLKEKQEIRLEKEKIELQQIEFGAIEYQGNVAYQVVWFEIPRMSYYENQTIEFQLIQERESLFRILVSAMKGGG